MTSSRAEFSSLLLALAITARAAGIDVLVVDRAGRPVEDAAVHVETRDRPARASAPKSATIDQVKRTFVPHVSVVQVGAAVRFPNSDDIRHQVYSFSAAKPFTLKLYSGTPSSPIVFDRAGEIALGCNIHDRMSAFVYVVDTPWFGKTGADGHTRIDELPGSPVVVHARHPDATAEAVASDVAVPAEGSAKLRLVLDIAAPRQPSGASAP